ncbi:MAG: hypothetical protein WCI73_12860, partial [Phycisphaerae bacterium]
MSAQAAHRPGVAPDQSKPTVPTTNSLNGNPLLPGQVDLAGFWPDLSAVQKAPSIAPAGFVALYSPADWDLYKDKFGTEAAAIGKLRSSGQLEFARKLIAAARAEPRRDGLKRLLLARAAAIAYRHREGTPVAAEAIAEYQKVMDLTVPADIAGLWTLADAMTRYATTPKPDRQKFSNLAAKANIQLTMLLLDAGQIDGALKVIKMINRHEVAVRNDAHLRPLAGQTKALASQTAEMMQDLGDKWTLLAKVVPGGPESGRDAGKENAAALSIYLYARFVKPQPELMNEILMSRGGTGGRTTAAGKAKGAGGSAGGEAGGPGRTVEHLHKILEQAKTDPLANYAAGEALKQVAEGGGLAEGVLKHRVMAAAWQYYRAFYDSPATETQRVKRTLAGIAMQALLVDG